MSKDMKGRWVEKHSDSGEGTWSPSPVSPGLLLGAHLLLISVASFVASFCPGSEGLLSTLSAHNEEWVRTFKVVSSLKALFYGNKTFTEFRKYSAKIKQGTNLSYFI